MPQDIKVNYSHIIPSPKVSIGMPVYNGEIFIKKALNSIISQTFFHFELIISDNSSIDNTESICRDYAERDSRIKYIRQSTNQGVIENFEFVLNQASSPYFMWAAADDVWDENWIESLLPVSEKYQCLAYGLVQSVDENDININHPANNRKFIYTGNKLIRRCKYYLEPNMFGKANPIYGIYPTSKLRKVTLSALKQHIFGADMVFLYDLLYDIEIRHVPGTHLYKREIIGRTRTKSTRFKEGNLLNILRFLYFIYSLKFLPMIKEYMIISDKTQAALLVILYPINFVYNLIGIVRFVWVWRYY